MSSPTDKCFSSEADNNDGTHLAPVMQELLQRFDKLTCPNDVLQLQSVKEETSYGQPTDNNIAVTTRVGLVNGETQQEDFEQHKTSSCDLFDLECFDFFEWINPSTDTETVGTSDDSSTASITTITSTTSTTTTITTTVSTTTASGEYCVPVYEDDFFGDSTISSNRSFSLYRSKSAPPHLFAHSNGGKLEISSQSQVGAVSHSSTFVPPLHVEDGDSEYFDLYEWINSISSIETFKTMKEAEPEYNETAELDFISDSYFTANSSEWLFSPWSASSTYVKDSHEDSSDFSCYFPAVCFLPLPREFYTPSVSCTSSDSALLSVPSSMYSMDHLLESMKGKFRPPFDVQNEVRKLALKANNMNDFLGLIPEHLLDYAFSDYKMLVREKMLNEENN